MESEVSIDNENIKLIKEDVKDNENKLKMFWLIENKDVEGLTNMCKMLNDSKQNIGMYFLHKTWRDIFVNQEEVKKIKVYMCGVMDFSPVQHACDIKWINGLKILIKHNIGCSSQGCGLPVVNIDYAKKKLKL